MNKSFTVLVNNEQMNKITDNITFLGNEYLLSIVNDFEEGKWMTSEFNKYIWDKIALTALSKKERDKLVDFSKLVEAAKSLRLPKNVNDSGMLKSTIGSEVAEIMLYGIMNDYYKAEAVVPKIFYKQNANDNAKGSDSVHIVIENNQDYSLWLGEAKFYDNIDNGRFRKIVESIENSLEKDKIKKETTIITNLNEIDDLVLDEEVKNKIKSELDLTNSSIDKLKPKLHIPIFILYECTITQQHDEKTKKYCEEIKEYHKDRCTEYFKKQISKLKTLHKYQDITFHLILFPIPNKEEVIEKFVQNATWLRNNS